MDSQPPEGGNQRRDYRVNPPRQPRNEQPNASQPQNWEGRLAGAANVENSLVNLAHPNHPEQNYRELRAVENAGNAQQRPVIQLLNRRDAGVMAASCEFCDNINTLFQEYHPDAELSDDLRTRITTTISHYNYLLRCLEVLIPLNQRELYTRVEKAAEYLSFQLNTHGIAAFSRPKPVLEALPHFIMPPRVNEPVPDSPPLPSPNLPPEFFSHRSQSESPSSLSWSSGSPHSSLLPPCGSLIPVPNAQLPLALRQKLNQYCIQSTALNNDSGYAAFAGAFLHKLERAEDQAKDLMVAALKVRMGNPDFIEFSTRCKRRQDIAHTHALLNQAIYEDSPHFLEALLKDPRRLQPFINCLKLLTGHAICHCPPENEQILVNHLGKNNAWDALRQYAEETGINIENSQTMLQAYGHMIAFLPDWPVGFLELKCFSQLIPKVQLSVCHYFKDDEVIELTPDFNNGTCHLLAWHDSVGIQYSILTPENEREAVFEQPAPLSRASQSSLRPDSPQPQAGYLSGLEPAMESLSIAQAHPAPDMDPLSAYIQQMQFHNPFNLIGYIDYLQNAGDMDPPLNWTQQLNHFLQDTLNKYPNNPEKVYRWLDNYLRSARGFSGLYSMGAPGAFVGFHYQECVGDSPLAQLMAQAENFRQESRISDHQFHRLQRAQTEDSCQQQLDRFLEGHRQHLAWKLNELLRLAVSGRFITPHIAQQVRDAGEANPIHGLFILQDDGTLRDLNNLQANAMELKVDMETRIIHSCFQKILRARQTIENQLTPEQKQLLTPYLESRQEEASIEIVREFLGGQYIETL